MYYYPTHMNIHLAKLHILVFTRVDYGVKIKVLVIFGV